MIYIKVKDYLYFDDEFYLIPNEVLDCDLLSDNSKILFASFHLFRKEGSNKIIESNQKLSSVTNINVNSISNCLKELENANFIVKEGRGNSRVIELYENFSYIQKTGDYTRIPSIILEHEEINSTEKILYIHLLKIYFYKLNVQLQEVETVEDLFTEKITRRNLALKMNCSKNTISNLVERLYNTKYNNKSILMVGNKNFYQKKNMYCCYIVTPTTKEGYELLKRDLENKNNIALSIFN